MVKSDIDGGAGSIHIVIKFCLGISCRYSKMSKTLTWQYSMTGSITCFQAASVAVCSSFDFATRGIVPPIVGIAVDRGLGLP